MSTQPARYEIRIGGVLEVCGADWPGGPQAGCDGPRTVISVQRP